MTTDGPAKAGRRRIGPLLVATAIAAVWLGSLGLLALRTANPVTVNRAQLLSSDAVVVGTIERVGAADVSLRVERTLAGDDVPETVRIGGVEPERFSTGGRFIVPLRQSDGGWAVTPAPPAFKNAPLVYPATEDTVRVVEEILTTAAAKPYE